MYSSNPLQNLGDKPGSIAHYGQPAMEISVDNSCGKYALSYSNMDTIQGHVTITANHNTRFDHLDITFVGTCQTFVDKLTGSPAMSNKSKAFHNFLTLKQPLDDAHFPCPRILAAHKTYTFPFFFTVPVSLLPPACTHNIASDHVRHTHLMLPPSCGDATLAGFGGKLLDDIVPEMVKIVYGIKVRISRGNSLLGEKIHRVRIKPAFEEQPPLNLDPSDPEYRPRQEKSIRKGFFKGKLGTLTGQSAQTKPFVIPGARTTNAGFITTMAKIVLRFDPAEESNAPPCLGSLATKMTVSTHYASSPRTNFPSRVTLGYDPTQGIYHETVSLSSFCIGSAIWEKQTSTSNPSTENGFLRRDSGCSTASTCDTADAFRAGILMASKNYKGGIFYTARISVPVTLPDNKNFLPTFHTCLVSRTYVLRFQISANAPGVSGPSLHLKVPIQVCANGSDTGNENARRRSAEAVMRIEANDVFTPRSTAPQLGGIASGSGVYDLPPEYVAFAPRTRSHNARVMVVR